MRRYIIFLLIMASALTGCAKFNGALDSELRDGDRLAAGKKYADAIAVYEKITKESPNSDRGACALFASASARVFYDNPRKDYALALQEFEEFIKLYPSHEKTRDARNWRHYLKAMLDLKKENERLNANIDQLKRIDIKHEERRRK